MSEPVLDSINLFPDQISQVVDDIAEANLSSSFEDSKEIFICGMGGSIYGYHIIKNLFFKDLKKPLSPINGYQIPNRVGENSLFLSCSYSGTTEETVAATQKALDQGAKVIQISTGQIVGCSPSEKVFSYRFDPKYNPSAQPRIGMGYMIFAPVVFLSSLKYLSLDMPFLNRCVQDLKNQLTDIKNLAREHAEILSDKGIIIFSAEHLSGAAHVARNQINETAKTYAQYHLIPELNHHLLEGLTYPKNLKLHFLLYSSNLFSKKNKTRMQITSRILEKQGYPFTHVTSQTKSEICDLLWYLQYGSYLSYYLAKQYGVDPTQIPWVDYFKKALSKADN